MTKNNAGKDVAPKAKTAKKKVTRKKTAPKKAAPKKAAPKKAAPKKTTARKSAPKKIVKKKAIAIKKTTKSTISAEEKRSIIALHAYYRWENAGRPLNSEIEYWLEAEKEINAQLKK